MRNNNMTQLDTDQIIKKKFDESNDADRVILVGGEKLELSIDSDKIAAAVKDGLNGISLTANQNSGEIQIITVPVKENIFIPELQVIEKQVFIPQIEYRTIEVPVITEKIVTIEKPIIIKEIEYKQIEIEKERFYPLVIKVCTIIQAVAIVAMLLINFLRK